MALSSMATIWAIIKGIGHLDAHRRTPVMDQAVFGFHTMPLGFGREFDRQGRIFRLIDDHIVTPHAYRRNQDSIGVGFVGDFRQEAPTLYQFAGGIRLFTWLLQRYSEATIMGHTNAPDARPRHPGASRVRECHGPVSSSHERGFPRSPVCTGRNLRPVSVSV